MASHIMKFFLSAITECFNARKPTSNYQIKKLSLSLTNQQPQTAQIITADILTILLEAEKNDMNLNLRLPSLVYESGWTEKIAYKVLEGIQKVLANPAALGQVLKDTFEKAVSKAGEFAKEHLVYLALVALGVLVILVPWAVKALGFYAGFGELGPIEGSFAAMWQARYAGYVPKGSLFSFF